MAETLEWTEGPPGPLHHGWPPGVSDKAMALDPAPLWARIETWTGYRWAQREFEAIVEGPGRWSPPVRPVTVLTVESWDGEWGLTDRTPSPLGGLDLARGTYRISGTVGTNNPAPADVLAAYGRLAEFLVADCGKGQFTSYSVDVGSVSESWRRDPEAMAMALQYSGAADLLRPYRRPR